MRSRTRLPSECLGKVLRQAREGAGLTLEDVSAHVDIDKGTISRIENGYRATHAETVSALLDVYHVEDQQWRRALDLLCQDVWRGGWWDNYAGCVSPEFVDLAWLEHRAHAIRTYDVATINDLFQTRDYAEALIRGRGADPRVDRTRELLDMNARRQGVLDRGRPVSVIVDEAVIRRPIGGPAIMATQLDHLVEQARRPNVELRIVPFDSGDQFSPQGSFRLHAMADPLPPVAHVDGSAGSPIRVTGDPFTEAHERLWKAALSAEESAEIIAAAAKLWKRA